MFNSSDTIFKGNDFDGNLTTTLGTINLKKYDLELNQEPSELIEPIKNSLKIFEDKIKQKHLQLILVLPKNLVCIKIDTYQLSQLIIHLMSNIINRANHGSISFAVNIEPNFGVYSAESENIIINFVIKYMGISILQINPHLDYGFDLSVTKKIVELMGGAIFVENQLEQITQIRFHIKSSHLSSQELSDFLYTKKLHFKRRPSLPLTELIGKKILIVESDQIHRSFLINQLHWAKCHCCTTDNANVMMQYVQNCFDLILIELQIQEQENDETVEIIKQILKNDMLLEYTTPIIGLVNLTKLDAEDPRVYIKINNFIKRIGLNDCLVRSYISEVLFEIMAKNIRFIERDAISTIHTASSTSISSTSSSYTEYRKKTVAFASSLPLSSKALSSNTSNALTQKLPNVNVKSRCVIS